MLSDLRNYFGEYSIIVTHRKDGNQNGNYVVGLGLKGKDVLKSFTSKQFNICCPLSTLSLSYHISVLISLPI